jgi:hypothetical protein
MITKNRNIFLKNALKTVRINPQYFSKYYFSDIKNYGIQSDIDRLKEPNLRYPKLQRKLNGKIFSYII